MMVSALKKKALTLPQSAEHVCFKPNVSTTLDVQKRKTMSAVRTTLSQGSAHATPIIPAPNRDLGFPGAHWKVPRHDKYCKA